MTSRATTKRTEPSFLFLAGKGGVGKTTCAAASAIAAAARVRTLIVSTDPAHSLGDVLGARLSPRPRRLQAPRRAPRSSGRGSLDAAEIDARRVFARWLAVHGPALGDVVERGTWLDRADVEGLLDLSIPGIDELVGLMEVVRLGTADYDHVVVDTAPTGHLLRFLAAPETVAAVARTLDVLHQEHRLIRNQLARVGRPEAADRLIERLTDQAGEMAALLRDPRRVSFAWVTLAEELSLAEAEDGVGALERLGVHVARIIVNRATPQGPGCPVCDRRRAAERRVIARVRRRLGGARRRVQVIPAVWPEPRGVRALAAIGRRLADPRRPRSAPGSRIAPRPAGRATSVPRRPALPAWPGMFRAVRLLFFGGKGGVGKTTVAAAAALKLARADPTRATLLLSTDPAHSLTDVFGQPVGDTPVTIRRGPPNLHVQELDAAAALARRRAGLEAALHDIEAAVGSATRHLSGGRGAAELIDLAPPGIDELLGLVSVIDARVRYPVIVMDTAPTGHALRLLEMPDAAREWIALLLRLMLKYGAFVRPGKLGAELVELSRSIRGLQQVLRNPRQTSFVVVTRAAAVPRLETERLLDELRRRRLRVPAVIVNAMTLAPGRCLRCRETAAAEEREFGTLARRVRRTRPLGGGACAIIQTPLVAPPPRTPAALDRWADAWRWARVM